MSEETTNRDTTETRILITEDKHSKFTVEYEMIIKGTEIVVPFRFSHLLGQMMLAILVITLRNYKSLLGLAESNSNPKGEVKSGKLNKGSKVP